MSNNFAHFYLLPANVQIVHGADLLSTAPRSVSDLTGSGIARSSVENQHEQKANMNKKMIWRMQQFENIYAPFIHKLVLDFYRLFNKELESGDDLFPVDSYVDIELAELPRGTKRPRLYIKRIFFRKLSEREELGYKGAKTSKRGWTCVRYCLS